jgi:glutamate-ammonia-ligase adenylyltransferase
LRRCATPRWRASATKRRCAPTWWRCAGACGPELDRSDAARFDLKQGEGGLVDLEFLLQERVLALAARLPELSAYTATPELLAALAGNGGLAGVDVPALLAAHAQLLARGLDCTLDRRPRLCAPDAGLLAARECVRAACQAFGLDFSAG